MRLSFKFNRPLSPHILIYNIKFNLLRSIFHRFSGLFLVTFTCFPLVFFKILFTSKIIFFLFFTNKLIQKMWIFSNLLFILNLSTHIVFTVLTKLNLHYDFSK